ncbi:methylmalonyl Co-A mutase-associated GTPase MeaB [Robertmurraya sp. DFI.2.37]|uniref:methylmalonyl Co-A mutase-associated GTPase MeaB n=1 Tax=Robertmurraya sp. DFI.2.37 TaxID=3031819 RepID=UPI0012456CE9|nr:methylmalonyl Co-A mutase-associated GTPase MeaB [Robertmurraya sp. DFI.2.37]MDF1506773.1 methylmalonyl Co-A mutase-associated GTPase MeaB [Robertmurraya sp. DFI.2.37]
MNEASSYFEKKSDVILGKLLKEVENQTANSIEILRESSARKGTAHIVGITGPPGSGKSTLVNKLCKTLAKSGIEIGIVAVDPTSPFTKGALLGDRTRMQELSGLSNVFIKSLATRGNLGGLAPTTADIVQVLDAYGKELIIIETVGVGQIEFDVLEIADTVVLVNVPGLGDSLQTLKAGIMEIADIYVVNQADRPGADESVRDLKMMVREKLQENWEQPVLKTIATNNEGMIELIDQIQRHKEFLLHSNRWDEKRKTRNLTRLNHLMIQSLNNEVDSYIRRKQGIQIKIQQVKEGKLDPYTLSDHIVEQLIKKHGGM